MSGLDELLSSILCPFPTSPLLWEGLNYDVPCGKERNLLLLTTFLLRRLIVLPWFLLS